MGTEPYNPGQLRNVYKYLRFEPQWLILGGPADADEAQTFVTDYPDGNVIGVEPCSEMVKWQRSHAFPGRLLHAALSDEVGIAALSVPHTEHRCSTIHNPMGDGRGYGVEEVVTVTLDSIHEAYGPFPQSILWLDIEGMELRALKGASKLLASGDVRMVNVEIMLHDETTTGRDIRHLLNDAGYFQIDHWDRGSGNHYDAVYLRREGRG